MTNHDQCYVNINIEISDQNEKPGLNRLVRELLPEEVTFQVKSKE